MPPLNALWLTVIIAHAALEIRAESNDDMLRQSMFLIAKKSPTKKVTNKSTDHSGAIHLKASTMLDRTRSSCPIAGPRGTPLDPDLIDLAPRPLRIPKKEAASYTPNHRPKAFEACCATSAGAEEKSIWMSSAIEISVNSMLRREGYLIYIK